MGWKTPETVSELPGWGFCPLARFFGTKKCFFALQWNTPEKIYQPPSLKNLFQIKEREREREEKNKHSVPPPPKIRKLFFSKFKTAPKKRWSHFPFLTLTPLPKLCRERDFFGVAPIKKRFNQRVAFTFMGRTQMVRTQNYWGPTPLNP